MKIIDTHLHIWDLNRNEYGWLKGNTTILNRSYTIPEIEPQLAASGVSEAILVQADNHFEDTDYMLENAEQYDFIKGVVGWLPLLSPEKTQKSIDKYLKNKYFKGVRHLIHDEANPHWLLQENVIESLNILAQKNIPYDVVGVKTDHIFCVQQIGEKIPQLRMIFDHLNQPPFASQSMGEWGIAIKEAAQNPNVYAKISGLGLAVGKNNWSAEDLKPYIAYIIEHFGVERCLYGGDWPVALLAGDYQYTLQQYKIVFEELLSTTEQEKIFYHNAQRFYGLV
jgi:L-fuconolactonase